MYYIIMYSVHLYYIYLYISHTQKPYSGFISYYLGNTEVKTERVTCGFVTRHRERPERKKKSLPMMSPLNN